MNFKIEELFDIAKAAGNRILDIYNDSSQSWKIEAKSDNSPLTIADREANKIICDGLRGLSQSFPIISEENESIDYEERKKWDYYWLVDPLDGTKEFIKRNGEFTVNIALVKGNEVYGGVVFVPVSGELYYAMKGEGAFYVNADGNEEKLNITPLDKTQEGLRVVCSRSHMNDETKEFVSQFNKPVLTSAGSSLKLLMVARGLADIYPRFGPTMEWDTAAAHAIVKEAGGNVTDVETGKEMCYNKRNLLNSYFIVE